MNTRVFSLGHRVSFVIGRAQGRSTEAQDQATALKAPPQVLELPGALKGIIHELPESLAAITPWNTAYSGLRASVHEDDDTYTIRVEFPR